MPMGWQGVLGFIDCQVCVAKEPRTVKLGSFPNETCQCKVLPPHVPSGKAHRAALRVVDKKKKNRVSSCSCKLWRWKRRSLQQSVYKNIS